MGNEPGTVPGNMLALGTPPGDDPPAATPTDDPGTLLFTELPAAPALPVGPALPPTAAPAVAAA